jgi:PST family polysaccharide transporter
VKGLPLIKSIAWASLEAASLILLSFLTLLVLARMLEPVEFGRASTVLLFVQLSSILVEHFFAEVLVQRPVIDDEHVNSAFSFSILIAFMIIVFAAIAAYTLFTPEYGLLLCVASVSLLPTAYIGIQSAILRRSFQFRTLALRSIIGRVAGAAAGISLAVLGSGAWSIIAQHLVMSFMGATVLWLYAPKHFILSLKPQALKDLAGFGLVSFSNEALFIATPRIYQLLASFFLGPQTFGYLALGIRLVDTFRELIGHVATNLALPIFSRLQHDLCELNRQFIFATSLVCLVAMPCFVTFAVCSELVVEVVLGAEWLPAAPVIKILALGAAFGSAGTFCYSVFSACGRPSLGLLPRGFDIIFTTCTLTLVASYGLTAVAIVWLLRNMLLPLIELGVCMRLLKIRLTALLRAVIWPGVLATIFGIGLLGARQFLDSILTNKIEQLFALAFIAVLSLSLAGLLTHYNSARSLMLHLLKRDR